MLLRAVDLAVRIRYTAVLGVMLSRNPRGRTYHRRVALARRLRAACTEHVLRESVSCCRLALWVAGHDYGYAPLVEAMQARDEGRPLGGARG